MVKVREDMTGWNMWEHGVTDSRLIIVNQVEDYIGKNNKHYAQWLCKCNCGNDKEIVARGDQIKSGHIKSCGCLNNEIRTQHCKNRKKTNDYVLNLEDENGKYGYGICFNTGSIFYFDMDDYNLIKDYCWCERIYKNKKYNSLVAHDKNNRVIRLSDMIGCKYYDHKDRNPLNNRKYNLRKATNQENARNGSRRSNNTSGFTGVSWNKNVNKWFAHITINDRTKSLGYFIDKEDAIKVRLKAEKEYFCEFAPQRHLFEQYGI